MNQNLTDVTVVLDRSGSMQSCREEAENGVNHFVETQKEEGGECLYSLVQFDTTYEFVHRGVPIKDVPKFTLVPRGFTSLLDAVGRAINETGDRLSKLDEDERPGLVVFVIVTDGHENSSREFTRGQIKNMIELQQNTYNWQFTFLGSNQDAFKEAGSIGIKKASSANYTLGNERQVFKSASLNVSRMRKTSGQGLAAVSTYTDEERSAMSDKEV